MKKQINCLVLLLFFGLTAPSKSQVVNTNVPDSDTTILALKDRHWSVGELNQTALQFLWSNGSMPKGLKLQTIAYIYPTNQTTMCEFYYTQGFGKPSWNVQIGYDGEVKSFSKGIKREGQPAIPEIVK